MIKKRRTELEKMDKDELINYIIDGELNRFVAEYANNEEGENAERDKRIPYIGWYWRNVGWTGDYIPIGHCGEFVGFMVNNKWDYPERSLTEDERKAVLTIIEKAYKLSREGGILSDIIVNTKQELDKLWDLMQTFTIPTTGWWVYGIQGRVAHADTAEDADQLIGHLSSAAPGLSYWKEGA